MLNKKPGTIRRLMFWSIAFTLIFLFSSSTYASVDELNQIIQTIKSKGKKWVAGETSISKLTPQERKGHLGKIIQPLTTEEELLSTSQHPLFTSEVDLPTRLDWRNYNGYTYVTPIRDQGSCGSCWPFPTTSALESKVLIGNNTPGIDLNLSEQILVSWGNSGDCGGLYILCIRFYP